MASNNAEKEIIDPKECSKELSNVAFDVSTEEGQLVQPCTLTAEGKATLESYIAAEHQPTHVENNFGIIIITAGGKCGSDASKSSNLTALPGKELANVLNIDIANNFGVIIVCENIQLNFDARSGKTIKEELKAKIQSNKGIPPDQLRSILDAKQLDRVNRARM